MFTWWRGRPTMDGKTARGASSPAKPAFTSPEPLSHTRAVVSSSSHILAQLQRDLQGEESGKTHAQRLRSWPSPLPGRSQSRGVGRGGACHLPSPRGRKRRVGGSVGEWGCGCAEKDRGTSKAPWPGGSPSAPGARRDSHLFPGPQPFTFSPCHKLRTHFGPILTPIHAHAPAGGKRSRDQGPFNTPRETERLPFRAPLSCNDSEQKKLEPNRKVWS